MKIVNKYYNFNEKGKKIILISDIHYSCKKDIKLLYNVLDRINSINPDYVCIPGDITDESYVDDDTFFIQWLKDLSRKRKVIVSLGNHEYYIDKNKKEFDLNHEFLLKIKKINNLYLLMNENKVLDGINFIGLDLGIDYYFNEKKSNINIKKYIDFGKKNILLCHSPVDINDIVNGDISLAFCGHMHGGVVPRILRPLFKNRGIISPTKKLFPKYAYGLKKVGNTKVITTSGIRVISRINKFYLFRNFFSAEVVIVNI